MDLELTDEQRWLAESVETLLARAWPSIERLAEASAADRDRVWNELVEFGALSIGGEEGLGAIELCLIARALGSRLTVTPFLGSAAARLALDASATELTSGEAIALALLERGSGWGEQELSTTHDGRVLQGEKVAVELHDGAGLLAVSATSDAGPAVALLDVTAFGVFVEPRPALDPTLRFASVSFERAPVRTVVSSSDALGRLQTVGALLAAAEAIGAASSVLELAARYAAERRQFGRTIGSFQAVRHLLADMYVRQASGWSTVLYAAAAFDDGAGDAHQVAQIAKAYVSRGAREVAHGAMQVFGGIAFTEEHPAHRFLRRIIVREQQFGDAAHHERALGRAIAQRLVGDRAGEPS